MDQQTTIEVEIDPEQVREETIEELTDGGAISESEVDKFETYVDLTQTTAEADPSHKSGREIIGSKLSSVKSRILELLGAGTSLVKQSARVILSHLGMYINDYVLTTDLMYGKISNLNVKRLQENTYVYFTVVSESSLDVTVCMDTSSTEFATLLEHFNASNAKELEDQVLAKSTDVTEEGLQEYYLPNNGSLFGKFRYDLFSRVNSVRSRLEFCQTPKLYMLVGFSLAAVIVTGTVFISAFVNQVLPRVARGIVDLGMYTSAFFLVMMLIFSFIYGIQRGTTFIRGVLNADYPLLSEASVNVD